MVPHRLRIAETPDLDGDPVRSPAQRRHDALIDLCRHFLDHQTHPAGRTAPPPPQRHRDSTTSTPAGAAPSPTAPCSTGPPSPGCVCDSALHRVVMAGRSTILDYGTATRTTPVNLWNALVVRDHGCRWPGCDRPAEWCEAHHVVRASEGGSTSPANEALSMRPPPPQGPPTRLAPRTRHRRHPGRHRPQRPHPHHPTTRHPVAHGGVDTWR